jgi:amino-acid N-acetyltransferase
MVTAMIVALVAIKRAPPSCLSKALGILSAAGLPDDGVEENFDRFLIAESGAGKIIGCVGMERYGDLGLLRSAAVDPEHQGEGIGHKLIRRILKEAEDEGVSEVALLTTTAKEYFQKKFGFQEARRSGYESRLANSPEWNLPRCSSAAFMTLKLNPTKQSIK